ncbi:MAG: hypothetical protein KatS3mg103_1128 [Phycisphaerales bacterium]|nr:MAG: hypothetical protein KatS3mg103_1128 [Phycisphaerales bacterium]
MAPRPDERYTLRAKVFDLVPQFFIEDQAGNLVGYCRQRLFKFREEIVIYTDRSCEKELLRIKARQIIDFAATYDVLLPDGRSIGSLRRKGLKSTFIRDEYLLHDAQGNQIATLSEDSTVRALVRRFVENAAWLLPQRYDLLDAQGREIARFRQHFNPFIFRLGVAVLAEDQELDDLMLIATAVVLAAIEGRQR